MRFWILGESFQPLKRGAYAAFLPPLPGIPPVARLNRGERPHSSRLRYILDVFLRACFDQPCVLILAFAFVLAVHRNAKRSNASVAYQLNELLSVVRSDDCAAMSSHPLD